MRGIVAIVTGMTLLLFFGMGFLIYAIATKAAPQKLSQARRELALPAAARVQLMAPWRNGVAVYVDSPSGDYLYFVDPAQEKPLSLRLVRKDHAVQNP